MAKKIKVLPITIKIENISLTNFLVDLPKISKDIKEVVNGFTQSVNFRLETKGSMSMGRVDDNSFNISCPDSQTLSDLMTNVIKFYEKKPAT